MTDHWLVDDSLAEALRQRLREHVVAATSADPLAPGVPLESARARHPRHAWFALGAVDAGNAAACLTAGAAGVAVIGAALEADPEPLLATLGILRG